MVSASPARPPERSRSLLRELGDSKTARGRPACAARRSRRAVGWAIPEGLDSSGRYGPSSTTHVKALVAPHRFIIKGWFFDKEVRMLGRQSSQSSSEHGVS